MHHNKQILTDTLKSWLPLAAVIVVFSGLIYGSVQQSYRQSANDPQIQIARDVADLIAQGTQAESIAPPPDFADPSVKKIDLKKSLGTFIMIYDDSEKLLGSYAILDGKNPEFPKSVLENVKKNGEKRVTWQPQPGVRMATVVTRYTGKQSGFVVVGRSLNEVESRVAVLTATVAIAAGAALILSLILIFIFKMMGRPSAEHHKHTEIIIDTTKE